MVSQIIISNKSKIITLSLIIVLMLTILYSENLVQQIEDTNPKSKSNTTDTTNLGFKQNKLTFFPTYTGITIVGNTNFTTFGLFTGSGIPSDPYIFENAFINASGLTGLSISNTDSYFIVQNLIINGSSNSGSAGIQFTNVSNSEIRNVTVTSSYNGIRIDNSKNNNITSNTVFNNTYMGIYLFNSLFNTFLNNTAELNQIYGFSLTQNSFNNTLINNSAKLNGNAGFFTGSNIHNTTFIGNSAIDNLNHGFASLSSINQTYINNIAFNNTKTGFNLQSVTNSTLINNVAAFNGQNGINLVSNSKFNTLIGNRISNNSNNGLIVQGSSNFALIKNNTIENNTFSGISVSSNNISVIGNVIEHNVQHGIIITRDSAKVWNNNITHNSQNGILIQNSDFSNISINQISKNSQNGIYILGSSVFSNIADNTVYKNTGNGFLIEANENAFDRNNISENGFNGFYLKGINNALSDNTAGLNNESGFVVNGSSSNILSSNKAQNNNIYGILITGDSYENNVQGNTLLDNNIFDARDDSTGFNQWRINEYSDNPLGGVYRIPGTAAAIDILSIPNFLDLKIPDLTSPSDFEYEVGNLLNTISWIATDTSPYVYYIYLNGTLIESHVWVRNVPIVIVVDNLPPGLYNYTIIVLDTFNNSVSDYVLVNVTDKPTDEPSSSMLPSSDTVLSTTPPDSSSTNNDSDNSDPSNAPGFTIILVLFSISFLIITKRRKK